MRVGVEMLYYEQNVDYPPFTLSRAQMELRDRVRMLWEQHDTWTLSAITSLVFGLPNADAVVSRLLRNPDDFKQVLQLYYGERIASNFRDLLKAHLSIAADLVNAAKAGDANAANAIERKWYANADAIAVLLGSINPYWPQEQWRRMLYRHLELVKRIAVDMLNGRYPASIAAYDENELHTLVMADVMSGGIIHQFHIT
ncbi:acetylglutamate kinase [Heliophilum fasciatum]|uniref:Acetylglutamate kinase n=1 Tax=Heliophilum fasciatum TaxID=35700 RepID=A0A4R2S016_9FIRM|nr:acetylglutamate kinase [Heliophilum fasciatum]MCW2276790.1 hypothetical protein [Heliophilum fasciatum]TCP68749.1 hypothetical protein EDD73_102145 [Heliophilum fasciatum]